MNSSDFIGYQVTESIQKIRVFTLVMNPIFGRAEDMHAVAVAATLDDLVSWYREQIVPIWIDDRGHIYRKSFRKGSPLENYNAVSTLDPNYHGPFGDGVYQENISIEMIPNGVIVIPHIDNQNLPV